MSVALEESKAEKAMRILREKQWDVRMDYENQYWMVQSNSREDGFKLIREKDSRGGQWGAVVTAYNPQDAILKAYEAVS